MLEAWPRISTDTISQWRRPLRGWESSKFAELDQVISSITLGNHIDSVAWRVTGDEYTTASGYKVLNSVDVNDEVWTKLWKQSIPLKTKIFMWHALHKSLPTLQLLKSRGIELDDKCKRCNQSSENLTHLLWECKLAKECWNFFTVWMEMSEPLPINLRQAIILTTDKKRVQGFNTCFGATIWTIWLLRNDCVFNNIKIEPNTMRNIIKERA